MNQSGLTRREVFAGLGAGVAAAALGGPAAAEAGAHADGGEPPFKLGTVTYDVPKDWDFDTLLKILPAAGVEAVELRTTHAHGIEPSLTMEQRQRARKRAADAGLRLLSLGTVCEFQSPDPATVKKNIESCREFVQLAQDLGCLGVKVRPNGLPREVPLDQTVDQIGKALRECGAFAQEHGVEIWVEVHGGGTQDPPTFRRILDACGHKAVGANWNSNPTDVKNGSVRESFELLRPSLLSCHINDLWGTYPYREFFGLLRESGYNRYTNCEVGTAVRPEDGLLFFRCYRGLWRELARG